MKIEKIQKISRIEQLLKHQNPLERAHYVGSFQKKFKETKKRQNLENICLESEQTIALSDKHIILISHRMAQKQTIQLDIFDLSLVEKLYKNQLDTQKIHNIHQRYKTTQDTSKVICTKSFRLDI